MTDSSKKEYFESFAIFKYAMHGVMRSAGSCTKMGTQLPAFSVKMRFSTVSRGGKGTSVCRFGVRNYQNIRVSMNIPEDPSPSLPTLPVVT